MKTVVHITIHPPVVEELLAKISALLHQAGDKVEMVVEPEPYDPKIKLTHEELFALPEELRMQYYSAHGGVFTVMHENGYGLTDEDIEDFHRYKEERDNELAALPREEALKRIYGK